MIGASAIQYLTWVGGTVVGVVVGPVLGDTNAWGLDASFRVHARAARGRAPPAGSRSRGRARRGDRDRPHPGPPRRHSDHRRVRGGVLRRAAMTTALTTWVTIAGLAITTSSPPRRWPDLLRRPRAAEPVGACGQAAGAGAARRIIAVDTLSGPGRSVAIDARSAGLLTAGAAGSRSRANIVVVVLGAVGVTALVRRGRLRHGSLEVQRLPPVDRGRRRSPSATRPAQEGNPRGDLVRARDPGQRDLRQRPASQPRGYRPTSRESACRRPARARCS